MPTRRGWVRTEPFGRFDCVTETFDFDIDRATDDAWQQFSDRLAEVLSVMDDSADLTIASLGKDDSSRVPLVRYTWVGPDRIRAQASGNDNLDNEYHLSALQEALLLEAGWERDPGSGDFRFEGSQEHDAHRLADLAVQALRDVAGVQHPVFLRPDQLAEILNPPAKHEKSGEFDADDVIATVPAGREQLVGLVDLELAELLDHPPVRDDNGDIAMRVGSTMVFLRVSDDLREIIVFATLVHDLAGRSRAAEVLNDLNCEARWVKFQMLRDRVFLTYSVMAHPFVPAHLQQGLRIVSKLADQIDDELAAKLGGRTTFPDEDDA